jgi:uncharacterized protein with PIN domain
MRFYIDEDAMSSALTRALRMRGFDVETAQELGMRGIPDEVHLQYAASQGRTLFSFNRRDYIRIHGEWLTAGRTHSGIILLGRRKHDIGSQLRGLLGMAETRGQAGMVDFLTVI